MKITKENLNLEQGLDREWIITNGIGGYSASSIIGANNRKYHGLLIAALTPPARRFLILSKVDESFENNLLEYPQYTRPEVYDGKKVPNVLISGNHENIRKWSRFMALKTTYENRPDLIDKAKLSSEDEEFLVMIKEGKDINFN